MFTRRKFLLHSASSLALTLGAARLSKAAVGAWAQQQGGSQDLQTGLVWLDYTIVSQSIWTYTGAVNQAANLVYDGYNDWRLPTLSEMSTAVSDGLPQNCPLSGAPGATDLWWSSTTAKSKGGSGAYAEDLRTGASQFVVFQTKLGQQVSYSALFAMFVRQGTI